MFRTADELLSAPDPAWPLLHNRILAAGPTTTLLAAAEPDGRREIHALQVSAKSFLGASAYHIGGLLLDSGWLRILGCGHPRSEWSITTATRRMGWGADAAKPPEGLLVAVDVLGGLFAINGGFLPHIPRGHIAYFGPDTLRWDDTGIGHSAWLESMLTPSRRAAFYADLRWPTWEQETAALPPNTALSLYPPPYTRESRPLESTKRKAAPLDELVALNLETARILDTGT
jgi:hypothetical protein